MQNISFQCLPSVYLVPKKFHCGLINSIGQEVRIAKGAVLSHNFNEASPFSTDDYGEKSSDFETNTIIKSHIMSKKSKEEKEKTRNAICPPVQIVCKSVQSEKITHYQLITSNKLENYKTNENNLKWCPIDFYECPKEPFRRNNNISITINDTNLKKQIVSYKTVLKNENKIPLTTLIIDYQVVHINDDNIEIESVIDLSNNKPFLQLLEYSAHEAEWEEILKLVELQLGQQIKNICIKLETFDEKNKHKWN